AIIAILAAMLLPALSKAREKARQAVCINNLKQMGSMIIMYSDETGYYPPRWNGEDVWFDILNDYMGLPHLYVKVRLRCPSARLPIIYNSYGINDYIDGEKTSRYERLKKFLLCDVTHNSYYVNKILANLGYIDYRHSGGANFLFTDGHVEWVKEGEFNDAWWY
ncbi:DUF1559 domain-containing protein, partial [Candidatus Calescamantes bacterium]|nr:DUF1559 domain-containing protein [Candidatus Calescamantes bacterium]